MICSTASSSSTPNLWENSCSACSSRPPNRWQKAAFSCLVLLLSFVSPAASPTSHAPPAIVILEPPEKEFFSKLLDYHGLPIKAHAAVSNEALYAAYARLSMLLSNQPMVLSN